MSNTTQNTAVIWSANGDIIFDMDTPAKSLLAAAAVGGIPHSTFSIEVVNGMEHVHIDTPDAHTDWINEIIGADDIENFGYTKDDNGSWHTDNNPLHNINATGLIHLMTAMMES